MTWPTVTEESLQFTPSIALKLFETVQRQTSTFDALEAAQGVSLQSLTYPRQITDNGCG